MSSYSHHLEIFSSAIVSSNAKGFEILTLESRQPEPMPRFPYLYSSPVRKRLTDVKHAPLGIFRLPKSMQDVDEYFICVYRDFAVHINREANVTRNSVIEFAGTAVSAAVDDNFLILFHDDFLEVRHVRDGGLCQIIAGKNIRLLNANNPNVLFAMAHPNARGRDLIMELALQDGRVRTQEHDADLIVTPMKTGLPSHVVASVLDEVQTPEAGTTSPFSSVAGSSLGKSEPSRRSSRHPQGSRGSTGKDVEQSCVV
ncbi:CNH domain-containing protein, partial [Amylocarpus encephaloides]